MTLPFQLAQRLGSTLLLLILAAPAAQAAPVTQQGRSCHLPGAEEGLRCVVLQVPLDYRQPNGPRQALHVTIAPAYR